MKNKLILYYNHNKIFFYQQDKLRAFELAYLANVIGDYHYNERRYKVVCG